MSLIRMACLWGNAVLLGRSQCDDPYFMCYQEDPWDKYRLNNIRTDNLFDLSENNVTNNKEDPWEKFRMPVSTNIITSGYKEKNQSLFCNIKDWIRYLQSVNQTHLIYLNFDTFEAVGKNTSDLWSELHEPDKNRKPPVFFLGRTHTECLTTKIQPSDLLAHKKQLKVQLSEIHRYAQKIQSPFMPSISKALFYLDCEDPLEFEYPGHCLCITASQLLSAIDQMNIFGGMGSWDDQVSTEDFDSEHLNSLLSTIRRDAINSSVFM